MHAGGWWGFLFVSFLRSARSIFKPFIFSESCTPVLRVVSPQFGPDDPVRKQPRFQSQVDRRHELYKSHQVALSIMETKPVSFIHSFTHISNGGAYMTQEVSDQTNSHAHLKWQSGVFQLSVLANQRYRLSRPPSLKGLWFILLWVGSIWVA